MSILDLPGDLAEVPLAAVLIEALNRRATGVLSVEQGQGTSRVFLRDGVPVAALSTIAFRPVGTVLLAAGVIDMDALERSLVEMARTGRRQGEVLVELGAATEAQVEAALAEQQAAYLAEIAGLASGRFTFDPSAPVPGWTDLVRISPLRAIVNALEKPAASALVVSALQLAAGGSIALAPGYRQLAPAFGWSAAEAALVDRLAVLTTVDAFFVDPGVSPERARAILAALVLLGLAASRTAPAEVLDAVPGLVVDLADVAGVPVQSPRPEPAPGAAAPPAQGRRSDPEEARRRRQRLLQRAMQNMGVGPLSGQPRPAPPRPPEPPPRPEGTGRPPPPSAADQELRRALDAVAPRARASDLFDRLGVPRTASREAVKAAYLQLVKALHPDRFATPALADLAPVVKALFAAVNEAYEVLSDDQRRAAYLARAGAAREVDEKAAALEFQKAEACVHTRDYQRARGFFEAALRADPRPEYQAAYAWALHADPRSPDRARAQELVQAALRDPACDRAALLAAVLAREDGDDEAAERLLRRALRANPRNQEAERELRAVEARRRARGSPGPRR